MRYVRLAGHVFNVPLMVHEGKLQIILGVLGPRMGFSLPEMQAETAPQETVPGQPSTPDDADPDDKIEVINVTGTSVNRIAMEPLSEMNSYERLKGRLARADADAKVRGKLLRLESYGGECAGLWDALDAIRASKEKKPIWASVDDNAFSAAYAMASQTNRIYVTRTAGVGSVGVIAVHFDFSEWAKNEGVKPTVVYVGSHKADFSPWQALPEEARTWLKASCQREYERFVQYVAEGRGLSAEKVRNTEAAIYEGQDGIDVGFADRLGTFDQALEEFKAELRGSAGSSGGSAARSNGRAAAGPVKGGSMEGPNPAESNAADQKKHTAAELAAARADGEAAGRKAERERVGAILGCDAARGRGNLARTLALETDTNAEAAQKILAAAPVQAAENKNPLAEAMGKVPNPNVGTDAGGGGDDTQAAIQSTLSLMGQAKGGR